MSEAGAKILNPKQIQALHKFPLYSVDGLSLSNGAINVTGLALPPDGNFARVRLKVDPGVQYRWNYPLQNPGAAHYYWYWLGAEQSQFHLEINLAQSNSAKECYRVEFDFGEGVDEYTYIRNTFYIPKNLNYFQTFPNTESLKRVQFFDNINGVVVRGYSDFLRLSLLSKHFGQGQGSRQILDWGCGHGRVIRFFRSLEGQNSLYGVDIDPDNVRWASENLSGIEFTVGPLMPPLPYTDESFDLIFGISVMTHLTESVQIVWMEELKRISKPGGLVMVTFSGDTDVAFTSRELSQAYIDNYIATGKGGDLPSSDLIGSIEDHTYYKNVKISANNVRRLCAPYFEVLDVIECMFGYQDLAVLKRI